MGSESNRVVLRLTRDSGLVAAVAGAVGHFADRLGFDSKEQANLVEASQEACRDTLPLLTSPDAALDVIVEDFDDRIEVTLEHHGQPVPTAGLETFAVPGSEEAAPGRLSGRTLMEQVDRVLFSTNSGTSRTTLVKYLPGKSRL